MNVPMFVANPVNAFGERIRNERRNFNLLARRQRATLVSFERFFEPFPAHFARYDFFAIGMTFVFFKKLHVFVRARVGFAHEFLVAKFIERFLVVEISLSHIAS